MATSKLGEAVDDNVGAPLEGPDEVGRGNRVVDDQRDTGIVADLAHTLDVEDVVLRICQHLAIEGLRVGANGGAHLLKIVGVVDERDLDTHLRQGVVEQVVGAAVKRRAGHDVIAGLGQIEDGQGLGRLAAADHQRTGQADGGGAATLQRIDAGFQRPLGGVHQPGVDVAHLGQREQVLGVSRITKFVAGRLVDGHRPGPSGRVGISPDMDLTCLETPLVAHRGETLAAES